MSTRTIAAASMFLVSTSLFSSLPAKAEALNPDLCKRVYRQVASASANQDSKEQNISGGGSYGPFSVNLDTRYRRSSAVSQSDFNQYYRSNCDSYIQAHYGVKLEQIRSNERMNANNNQTRLLTVQSKNRTSVQITDINSRTQVQTNREDNRTRRSESKDALIGSGINSAAQVLAAVLSRPRNPEPATPQPIASNAAPTLPTPSVDQAVQPAVPVSAPQPVTQVAYAPQVSSAPTVMLNSSPTSPVSPVVIAKVNAALASQGLVATACNVSPIVVLNIGGQYTACAQPSAAYPPGNYRLNLSGF